MQFFAENMYTDESSRLAKALVAYIVVNVLSSFHNINDFDVV